MTERLRCPPRPCPTCPYRQDVPSGLWDRSEYEKLPAYDGPTPKTPQEVFHCHQENATGEDTVCVGWLATHGTEPLGVRLAFAHGSLTMEDVERAKATDVPLHASGREACEAGLQGLEDPDEEAQAAIDKLLRRGAARFPKDA